MRVNLNLRVIMTKSHGSLGLMAKVPALERLLLPEGCRRPKVEAARRQQEALEGGHFGHEPETAM